MDVSELIANRYSPLAFSDEVPDEEIIMQLFEAARWAPSCFNEQPWRFIYVTKKNKETYEKLFECLVDTNKNWAKTAPVLILVLAKKNFLHNNKPNYFHMYDTGMAVENLIISAMEKSIYVHQMAGFSAERARENFNISDDHTVISVAALGYPGDVNVLNEQLQQRSQKARARKNISDIFYSTKS